jgi:release factor glutamine methyltransferase
MKIHSIVRLALALGILLALSACSPSREARHYLTIPTQSKYDLEELTPYDAYPGYRVTRIDGREFLTPAAVIKPSVHSVYLLSHWEIRPGETVLDIGTGSGIQAVFAAEKARRVVATDISPSAVATARLNVQRNKLGNKIEVRQGDLFEPLTGDERFDVVLFNIDYPYDENTQGLWAVHERFFAQVRKYLKPGGRIYYQAGKIANISRIYAMATKNRLRILRLRMDAELAFDKEPMVMLVRREEDITPPGFVSHQPD